MIIFFVIIVFFGWIWSQFSNTGYSVVMFAITLALVLNLVSYFKGDKIALAISKAKEIKKEENPYVFRMVENLSMTAGTPMPKVYIIQDPNINAFATGRDPQNSSIAVTTGAIEKLANEELEGVIAHELSHIKNYDIRLMMIVIVCVGIITLLADFFLRTNFIFGYKKSNNKNGGPLIIIGLLLAILSPLFAKLIQLAVSRKREYLADAAGALLTRYPEGLARALEKIDTLNQPMKSANHATAHLYIANPFKVKVVGLFSTHPPLNERVAKLRSMA